MTGKKKKYRLITRSDMDGIVCAALLKELDMVDEIIFVHPKDMQDGKVEVTGNDIITNLPYVPGVHLCIDHHLSETLRSRKSPQHIIDPTAPSAARVAYEYFGGRNRFPVSFDEMMQAVDKADSGQFTRQDVLHPEGWELLSFIMDGRTGFGRFKNLRVSNMQLMMELIDHCRRLSIDEILKLPDVKDRVELYFRHEDDYRRQLLSCSVAYENLVVLDLRNEEFLYPGNRFMLYALYPECNISLRAIWGPNKEKTVFAVGKSIFNRTSKTNVGELMFRYGGGGHEAAGTCQFENENAETGLKELIEKITADG